MIQQNANTTKLINILKTQHPETRPLNKKEERQMIEQNIQNRDKLNELLFMHNVEIVFSQAKRFASRTNDFDNLVQEGMRGLAEACKRFDPDKNIKFITYGTPWVRKYILQTFYGKNKAIEQNSISIDAPISVDLKNTNNNSASEIGNFIANEIDASYVVPTIEKDLQNSERKNICKTLFNKLEETNSLSSDEKSLAEDIFYNNMKMKDISKKHNMSMSMVSKAKIKILNFFRKICANDLNIKSYEDLMLV